MKLTKAELGQKWQSVPSPAGRTSCPPAEALARAAANELSSEAREQLADHLILCTDCAEELRVLRELHQAVPQWVDALPVFQNSELPAPKSSWRERLAEFFRLPSFAVAAIAVLLLFSLTLGWWALALRSENHELAALGDRRQTIQQELSAANRELDETRRQSAERARQYETQLAELKQQQRPDAATPQINVSIVSLEPQGVNRGAPDQTATVIKVPARAELFTVVLNVSGQAEFSDYALQIANARGQVIWGGAGLRKSPENTFTLALPRSLLPAGRYRFRLDGVRQGRHTRIEEYPIQIVYQ